MLTQIFVITLKPYFLEIFDSVSGLRQRFHWLDSENRLGIFYHDVRLALLGFHGNFFQIFMQLLNADYLRIHWFKLNFKYI